MFKPSRNRYPFRNKVVVMLATVALATSTVAPATFADEASPSTTTVHVESYYNYTTNSPHFASITNKPATISTIDGISTVTLPVRNYDIFTTFEIDGQVGQVIGTFEEEGTNYKGEPTTIKYTNVQFTFSDIKAAKDAIIAYKAGTMDMRHTFKLDFTPGEYKANEIAFDTYYKGEANTAAFKAVNSKPAIVTVNADTSYDVTLQISGYDLFNKFEIDGQTGIKGDSFTEKGTDRNGNETDIVYTNVTFTFKDLEAVKKAVLGYQAGQTAMTHEYEIDFTPGDYVYTPPAEATYDGDGTKLTHTLVGETAARFASMFGNSYAEKTADGYNVFIELKSASILSTFTINGTSPTTVKEEKDSDTKVVSIAVKDITAPLTVEAAVKYAPTNISTLTMQLALPEFEETPELEEVLPIVVNAFANGFYDASLAFEKDTGNSFIQQQTQLFFINDTAYVQLAVKNSGIEYININGVQQQPLTTVDGYHVYTVKVPDITKPLSVDLSVNIPNVYEHVYEGLILHITDVKPSAATAFTLAPSVVQPITVAPKQATTVMLLTHAADVPVTSARIQQTADDQVQFTLAPLDERLQKITSKDGKHVFYNKPARTIAEDAVETIVFTAPSISDVAFVYIAEDGTEKTAELASLVAVDAAVIDVPTVPETQPTPKPEPTTPEDGNTTGNETTPPATGGSTTPPATGGGTVINNDNGTYNASISFGATGDSFLRPTATVIKDGHLYKVRVVVQGANAIQSFTINSSTEVAPGVYEFTTTSLSNITATMHVVVPEANYEHTYENIAVTLSVGAKTSNNVAFPAPPTTNGDPVIPPTIDGGAGSTPDVTDEEKEPTEQVTPEDEKDREDTQIEETPNVKLPFTDVQGEYVPYVQALYAAGITTGTTATTFEPKANMTRAQFAVMIARTLQVSSTKTPAFTDVQGKWYASSVQALAEAGIVTGTTSSTFEPGATLTRQQAAVMLYRLLQHYGYQSTVITPTFNDTAAISAYAHPAFATLQQLNILTGDQHNANPREQLTRGQMAKLLHHTLQIAHNL